MEFGIVSGVAFGLVTVLLMLPLKWNSGRQKLEAIVAAAFERFSIGFVVVHLQVVAPCAWNGLVIGLIMSLPSAIITRAYVPVILVGGLGAALIGVLKPLLVR